MDLPEHYRGREQTYIKHLFLQYYLERVAYNIYSFLDQFVYVDGFSGPWRSKDEKHEDTSFVIAINKLREIRDGFAQRSKRVNFRCIFVEKDLGAFTDLQDTVSRYSDVSIDAHNGEFEELIGEIVESVGRDFSLTFIDPTGWTGFALKRISPLLRHSPGEVIVNFMYDDINRHINERRPEQRAGFVNLFAAEGWQAKLQDIENRGISREQAILELYVEGLKNVGQFPYVTYTRILKTLAERTYFYLIYATRHVKGLIEFRNVERRTAAIQRSTRVNVQQLDKIERTGQEELFPATDLTDADQELSRKRNESIAEARRAIQALYRNRDDLTYEEIVGRTLVHPLVSEPDLYRILDEQRKRGAIRIPQLRGRQLKPELSYRVEVIDPDLA